MNNPSARMLLKRALPLPVRRVLRAMVHYVQRLGRWPIILWQVRGATWSDQWILCRSALAAPVVSLRDLTKWQDPVLLEDAVVDVRGIGRFDLRARCDDLWHVLPWREDSIANLLKDRLRPGDVFIDAGANIGVYTVLASRLVGEAGKVISVEMMPETADRLESHIRMNSLGNVSVARKALSDTGGATVVATVQASKFGQATIASESDRYGVGRQVDVTTVTLDELTSGLAAVRLMKIDVEGAELMALNGARKLLQKLEALVYESWGWRRVDVEPVDRLLEEAGFSLSQLDGNNWVAQRIACE